MSVLLIRHGEAEGNAEGRYIGCRTDALLSAAGRAELLRRAWPAFRRVYASPMRRCVETVRLICPGVEPVTVPDLRECDFGDFEGKNYAELNGRPDYQAWIDSGGTLPFPGGEDPAAFRARCAAAFARIRAEAGAEDALVVAHGGTLMAVMDAFARPHRDYFAWQAGNGEGFWLGPDGAWRAFGGRGA